MSGLKLVLSVLALISCQQIWADGTQGGSGGGDLECDAQIRGIIGVDHKAQTGSLYYWYSNKGPQRDSLLDLSSSKNPASGKPYTKKELASAMLGLMNMTVKTGCTHRLGSQDPRPVVVGGEPKVCRTIVANGVVDILCDSEVFLTMKTNQLTTEDLQIQQINHEFAINVPGLEPDLASVPASTPYILDISTYAISSQLSMVTERKIVSLVMVKDPAETGFASTDRRGWDGANVPVAGSFEWKDAFPYWQHFLGKEFPIALSKSCNLYNRTLLNQVKSKLAGPISQQEQSIGVLPAAAKLSEDSFRALDNTIIDSNEACVLIHLFVPSSNKYSCDYGRILNSKIIAHGYFQITPDGLVAITLVDISVYREFDKPKTVYYIDLKTREGRILSQNRARNIDEGFVANSDAADEFLHTLRVSQDPLLHDPVLHGNCTLLNQNAAISLLQR